MRNDKIQEKQIQISEASGSSSVKNVMSMDSFNILSKLIQTNQIKMADNYKLSCTYFLSTIVLLIGLVFSKFLMNTFADMENSTNSVSDKSCNYTTYQSGFYYYLYDFYAYKRGYSNIATQQALLPGFN